jgi:hypothetical protein
MMDLAIQFSGSNPNMPPLGTWLGIGMIVLIIFMARRGK